VCVWSNHLPTPLTMKFNITTACSPKTLQTTEETTQDYHRHGRDSQRIHSEVKSTGISSEKPDHAQIQLLHSYLFVIVLLIKLHYRKLLHFLASWPFITIFRLPLMFISTLHLPNKYKYKLTYKPNVWNTPNAASPCTHSQCPKVTLQRQWRT